MELKAKCITPDGPCDIYSKSDVDKYLKELEEKHNEETIYDYVHSPYNLFRFQQGNY